MKKLQKSLKLRLYSQAGRKVSGKLIPGNMAFSCRPGMEFDVECVGAASESTDLGRWQHE
jgi:hypothetical protein